MTVANKIGNYSSSKHLLGPPVLNFNRPLSHVVPASFPCRKLQKSLSLELIEITFNIMICSARPLSVQQFVKNFHLGVQTQFNMMTCSLSRFIQQWEKVYSLQLSYLISYWGGGKQTMKKPGPSRADNNFFLSNWVEMSKSCDIS